MEKSKIIYQAKGTKGLILEGSAYTIGGVHIEPVQVERENGKPPKLNTGMYYVTVTMMVDEVECI